MTRRSLERRRRAALPAALAAFTFLVIAASSDAPARWSDAAAAPAMTIVLPPAVAASAPADRDAPPEPVDEPLPLADADPAPEPAAPTPAEDVPPADDEEPEEVPGDDEEATAEDEDAIRHVFVVVLAQTDLVALADDAAAAPYLAGELAPQGTLLTNYASIARGSLANGIALVSGQGPTQQTLLDCPTAAGAAPADVPDVLGDDGQQLGDGCIFPFATGTVADQLAGAGLAWRAYVEGASQTCPLTPRNPFAFFHSLLDGGACARSAGGLDRLDADLAGGRRAPALLYVVPDACHDGRAEPCAPGAPAGPAAADAFLSDVVPRILASPAYADGGLLVVTSDGPPAAPTPVPALTPASYPNAGDAAAAGAARVGALLVGEGVRVGARSDAPASHFTLLRTISDLFELQPLGYAGAAALAPLPERVLRTVTARSRLGSRGTHGAQ